MRFFYTLLIYLLSPFILLRLYLLGIKKPTYRSRWQERFGFLSWDKIETPVIWLHAVSVGEVNTATSVINRLLTEYVGYTILVTTITPTGAMTVKQHFGDAVLHRYLPYDFPFAVHRFLKCIKPVLLITMETEIWPNLYRACHDVAVPILIINARLSKKSAKGYQRVSRLMRQTLSMVDIIAAQTAQDATRFIAFGANKEKVFVTGNLKFDIMTPSSIIKKAQSLKQYFSVNRPVWIAASTHKGEEPIILQAHRQVLEEYNDAILILAPRHPERIAKVVALCNKFGFDYKKRTDQVPFEDKYQVYLLDTLGELQLHYAVSQLAFVGGSLVKTGGQNMIEPTSLGLPVITGPYTYNFTEITELLTAQKALICVKNAVELATEVCYLMGSPGNRHALGEKGREIIRVNKGNIDRLMELIDPYLSR